MTPHFYAFWAINDALEYDKLVDQLDSFLAHGFGGVVFHPRFYPNEPAYLSESYFTIVSKVILAAKAREMDFWIYDEDGWPSGTVGGKLLKQFPEDRQKYLDLTDTQPESPLSSFQRDGKTWYLEIKEGHGVDYFSPTFTQHFIELTYERYRTGLSAEAFAHVSTFFCDEPEFGLGHMFDTLSPHGSLPWTDSLLELYQERFSSDLIDHLPALFFDTPDAAAIRVQFHEFLTDLFCNAFLKPINDWCNSHGKRFTAHIKGEEHPLFQVPMVGSCHQVYQHLGIPGIDALERFPSGTFFPRQLSSAAQQFGNGDCMAECFGGAGWGATPEDLERYLLWLGGNGINYFVFHLAQYQLNSDAIRDWPTSQPRHLNWSKAYKSLLDRVRRQVASIEPASDTLYIAPYRAIMERYHPAELLNTNIHNAATYPDSEAGRINRRFIQHVEALKAAGHTPHFCDERSFEAFAQVKEGCIQIGNTSYSKIILDEATHLSTSAQALLESVPVISPDTTPLAEAEPKTHGLHKPLQWTVSTPPENQLFIELSSTKGQQHQASFHCAAHYTPKGIYKLYFADVITGCTLNARTLTIQNEDDGSVVHIAPEDIRSVNALAFTTHRAVDKPFVWLRGQFNVHSQHPFSAGPNQTHKTLGPLVLGEPSTPDGEWTGNGYPFLKQSICASTVIQLTQATNSLRLSGQLGDAIGIRINQSPKQWIWGPDWTLQLNAPLPAGTHSLEIELIPSTYNTYGPHHYLGGDAPVISPDQFAGKKNFADPTNFPENTHGEHWHFKPLQLPTTLHL